MKAKLEKLIRDFVVEHQNSRHKLNFFLEKLLEKLLCSNIEIYLEPEVFKKLPQLFDAVFLYDHIAVYAYVVFKEYQVIFKTHYINQNLNLKDFVTHKPIALYINTFSNYSADKLIIDRFLVPLAPVKYVKFESSIECEEHFIKAFGLYPAIAFHTASLHTVVYLYPNKAYIKDDEHEQLIYINGNRKYYTRHLEGLG